MRTRYYAPRDTEACARLTPVAGGYAFASTYDSSLVSTFKARIPGHARRWDKNNRVWIVDPAYAQTCVELADTYLGVQITVPQQTAATTVQTRLVKLEYLGRCKDRGNGESSAYGYADGDWTLVFPENVLREWFEAVEQKPGEKPTMYAILSVKASATLDEIRSAHRRLARQWHPDLCSEPDAAEQFKVIQAAYEVLSDVLKRRKYDAGLALQTSMSNSVQIESNPWDRTYDMDGTLLGYRASLRCGWVLVEGKEALARFSVDRICQWEDIVRWDGKTLVTSWPMGAKHFVEKWV